jgi:hypothetical protein
MYRTSLLPAIALCLCLAACSAGEQPNSTPASEGEQPAATDVAPPGGASSDILTLAYLSGTWCKTQESAPLVSEIEFNNEDQIQLWFLGNEIVVSQTDNEFVIAYPGREDQTNYQRGPCP